MKKFYFREILLFFIFTVVCGCKKNILQNDIKGTDVGHLNLDVNTAKDRFAIILSKAVSNNADIRSFIRSEALKQMDNDYDVFYYYVKDKIVANGKTFRELILPFFKSPQELENIENAVPLLTFYIPELPSGFNAQTWNSVKDKITVVADVKNNNQSIFYMNGENYISLSMDEIPGFPTIVVKENERMKLKNSIKLKNAAILNENDFSFIDDTFNGNVKVKAVGDPTFNTSNVDPSIINSFNIMGLDNNYWQRDNIYYGLDKSNDTKGPLNRRMFEYIKYIKFTDQALYKMMDQNDPKYQQELQMNVNVPESLDQINSRAWSEGRFEIKIDVLVNNLLGAGTTITKYINVSPTALFNIRYSTITKRQADQLGITIYTSKLSSINSKWFNCEIPLQTWDLQNNGFTWKYLISEVDDQETETRTETTSTEFATNFGLDLKIGLKFGASAKTTKTSTFTLVTNRNSDDLGTLESNFSDPVTVSFNPGSRGSHTDSYSPYIIKNPMVEMVLMPTKNY